MMKTAVIGASGYVGRRLLDAFRIEHPDTVGTRFRGDHPDLIAFDLNDPDLPSLRLVESGHHAVLISSAIPDINFCENNPDISQVVNVRGPLEVARQSAKLGLRVIFFSTDHVYEGTTGGYTDDAPTHPTTRYGKQKVEVERALASLDIDHLVIRLNKVYEPVRGRAAWLDDIAGRLISGTPVRAATDQFFCPTDIDDLIHIFRILQDRRLTGVINVSGPERWSRHGVARALAERLELDPSLVSGLPLHEFPGMKGRPLDTTMRCARLEREIAPSFTPFDEGLRRLAAGWRA